MRQPDDLPGRVSAFLQPRLSPGERLCLGYSGGLDSTVLLHLLAGLRTSLAFELTAVHVHHGLSANADAWAAVCGENCARLGIGLTVHKVRVEAKGHGLEAAAREARYAVFASQTADYIVLAHHLDDQVETFFLHLLRGAGVAGLAGMPSERGLGAGSLRLLRPLLGIEREDLRRYAAAHGLDYCEDESNLDLSLNRNFLRQVLLPQLETRFPAYRRTVARAADHLRDAAGILAGLAEQDAERLVSEAGVDCRGLADLGPARAENLLRHWLGGLGIGQPTEAQLKELLRQALQADSDASPAIRLGGQVVRRHRGLLIAGRASVPSRGGPWQWQGESRLDLGESGTLEFTQTTGVGLASTALGGGEAWVRLRAGGERIQPDCRRPRRALKKILQERGIPAWERTRLPVLWVGGKVAWVAGVGVDCGCQAADGAPGWLISWRPPRR